MDGQQCCRAGQNSTVEEWDGMGCDGMGQSREEMRLEREEKGGERDCSCGFRLMDALQRTARSAGVLIVTCALRRTQGHPEASSFPFCLPVSLILLPLLMFIFSFLSPSLPLSLSCLICSLFLLHIPSHLLSILHARVSVWWSVPLFRCHCFSYSQ